MGWGSTIKTKIRIYGLKSEKSIASRKKEISESLDKLWDELSLLATVSPSNLVTNYTVDNQYGNMMKTRKTLSDKVDEIFGKIKKLTLEEEKLDIITDTVENREEYKVSEFGGNCISRFFKELAHELGNEPKYGLERTCFVYFNKPRVPIDSYYDLESFMDEHLEYLEMSFQRIKDIVLTEPKDMIVDCEDPCCEEIHTVQDAVRALRNEYENEKESLMEDLFKWAKAEATLEDEATVKEFCDKVVKAKADERKWEEEKDKCTRDVKKEFGISPCDLPNMKIWDKFDNRVEELMKERGIPEKSPVKWHEIYECKESDWL